MPRFLLILWLIGSLLGYGVAAAAELHGGCAVDGAHGLADVPQHPADDISHDGDHCAHGVFHLVGLTAEAPRLPISGGVVLNGRPAARYGALFPPDFERPPRLS